MQNLRLGPHRSLLLASLQMGKHIQDKAIKLLVHTLNGWSFIVDVRPLFVLLSVEITSSSFKGFMCQGRSYSDSADTNAWGEFKDFPTPKAKTLACTSPKITAP